MTNPETVLRRLRWRCRRGMKEMDAMLSRYLERPIGEIPLEAMERLLECQDDELWQWLLGRARPADPDLAGLIDSIRSQSAKSVDRP